MKGFKEMFLVFEKKKNLGVEAAFTEFPLAGPDMTYVEKVGVFFLFVFAGDLFFASPSVQCCTIGTAVDHYFVKHTSWISLSSNSSMVSMKFR